METRRRRVASEIRRPGVRAVRERVNGFGLYRLSSVYGTSYPRAALVLGCLLLLLSLLFLWTGLAPAEPSTGPRPAAVEYRLWPDAQHRRVEAKEWLQDFTSALIFTLSIATFQKDRQYQAAGRASEFLVVATVVLVGSQAALLLFAVRRRFKR